MLRLSAGMIVGSRTIVGRTSKRVLKASADICFSQRCEINLLGEALSQGSCKRSRFVYSSFFSTAESSSVQVSSAPNASSESEHLREETDRLLDILKSYQTSKFKAEEFDNVMEAWSRTLDGSDMEAADRAFSLLVAFEECKEELMDESSLLKVNIAWYNNVMHAYALSSGGRTAAEKAESILNGMLTACREHVLHPSAIAPVEPTTLSFNIVINAWAKSGERDSGHRAEQIFTLMEDWTAECSGHGVYNGAEPNARTMSGVMDAWAQSGAPKAEERVLSILMHVIDKRRRFLEAKNNGGPLPEEISIQPNVIMFNSAIHAWANSKRGRNGAEKAEEILRMMELLYEKGEYELDGVEAHGLKPNTRTLSLIIDAWAECEKIEQTGFAAARAQHFLDLMEKLFREGKDVKPNYITFTSCITAWSRSRRSEDAPERAEALLGRLLDLYKETGDEDLKPSVFTGNAVISAWANSRRADSAERAEAVLSRLQDFCQPDVYSYNSAINAHARKGDDLAAKRLLQQMEDRGILPDEVTFNTVIFALSKSSRQGNAEEAETLLEKMNELYAAGREQVKPTAKTYTTVIGVWRRSKDPLKAEKAHRTLMEMTERYQAGDESLKPDVIAFSSFIGVCAKSRSKSALRLALQTFEEMKQSSVYDNPNSVTYVALMNTCCQLSSDQAERARLLQAIFEQCCQDGMISKQILVLLKSELPPKLRAKLKIGDVCAKEWSRNVSGRQRPQ